jgi:drug/metabolite transporter (DMT)-like permease
MTNLAITLLVLSACTHAGWNLLGKRRSVTPAFMLLANTLGFLFLAPILLVNGAAVISFSPLIWFFLISTGFWQAWYYISLAGAYRSGDLSIAYPLARSFPVIFVTIFTMTCGLKSSSGWVFFLGMVFVVGGSFVLPMKRFSDISWRNYLNRTSFLAITAAIGTAGYSIIDDRALFLLRSGMVSAVGNTSITLLYAFLEGITSSIWLGAYVLMKKPERQMLQNVQWKDLTSAGTFGLIIYLGYSLVLLAMAYVADVSYVIAFRQLSIPLGALLGVLLLKEPHPLPKFTGVGLMFLGLVLVGFA